jgi:hypothetical protein
VVLSGETSFFRNPEVWERLREVLADLSGGRRTRIWSAACSDGREAYSAAMLAELPVRIAGVWFVVLLLVAPAYVGTVLLNTDATVVGWGLFVVLFGAKLAVDAALLRVRYESDPGGLTRLFVPNRRERDQSPA